MKTRWTTAMGFLVALLLLVGCGTADGTQSEESVTTPTTQTMPDADTRSSCPEVAGENGLMTADQFRSELECTVKLFEWPDSMVPTSETIDHMVHLYPDWETSRFADEMRFSTVGFYNVCAWYTEWIDARASNDSERENGALFHMKDYVTDFSTNVPGFPKDGYHESITRNWQSIAERASLGDETVVQAYLQDNDCDIVPWQTTTSILKPGA